jgi:DNA-binding NarL/FixJ family response regulator
MARPNVLIVTPHPVIGAGLEAVLRLEDLYELRRAGTLADGLAAVRDWPADAVLIDAILADQPGLALGVPAIVLAGDAERGERVVAQLAGAQGWLPKDSPPAALTASLDRALGIVRVRNDVKGTLGMVVAVVIVLGFLAALGLFVWRFFLS